MAVQISDGLYFPRLLNVLLFHFLVFVCDVVVMFYFKSHWWRKKLSHLRTSERCLRAFPFFKKKRIIHFYEGYSNTVNTLLTPAWQYRFIVPVFLYIFYIYLHNVTVVLAQRLCEGRNSAELTSVLMVSTQTKLDYRDVFCLIFYVTEQMHNSRKKKAKSDRILGKQCHALEKLTLQ